MSAAHRFLPNGGNIFSTGDLKLGVVPRNEDILQLVYEEYVYDGSVNPTTDTNPHLTRNLSISSMNKASVNKWAAPIAPRKSLSFDSNGYHLNNNNNITENTEKKYDPCVQFVAGKTIHDGRSSRSESISSSGSATPLAKSGKGSPGNRGSNSSPCVSFIAGKPQVVISSDSPKDEKRTSVEGSDSIEPFGVQPQTLQKALRKEVQKKGYSVGTRLAPKPMAGVSKPGAVSNIAGLFASGKVEELSSSSIGRKKSATFVLRDDFQIRSCKNKVSGGGDESGIKFNVSVEKRKDSNSDKENPKVTSPTRRGNNLSSLTSQATLVESQNSPSKGIAALVNNTIIINSEGRENKSKRYNNNSPMTQRKRTLLSPGRKMSISSVENSEDEDFESNNESKLDNWKGRRVSYLMANEKKKAEKQESNNLDSNMEADDEDSDTNSNKKKMTGQKSVEETEVKPIIKEGPLNRKLERSSLDRKKPIARTWKPIYAVLKGHRLFCYKEGGADGDDEIIQPIPVRSAIIEIANDYGKRKHVFRMVTSHGNEYLFQAEDAVHMVAWVNTLRAANPDKESLMKSTAIIKQEKMEEIEHNASANKLAVKDNKKGLSIRRSHFSLRGSKKSRSPNAAIRTPKEPVIGKTFGRNLRDCPPAKVAKNVPLIIEHCCNTIESRGKEMIGIYRIPGNAAAVQALQRELDEKNPDAVDWNEEKWHELNNIGSLLKSFLRRLAEPIVPNDMYAKLIESNRVPDRSERLKCIKYLVKSLPEYHYETLEFLMKHLKVLADNSDKNKMDPKNIAIVFGPNVIRTSADASMVQNMPDQCRIIETLLKQCDWMFAASDDDTVKPIDFETDTEVISAGVAKNLLDCLQQNNAMEQQDNNNDNNTNKKGGKLSTLKSNLSMKLRSSSSSSKIVSPKFLKKPKGGSILDDNETDEDTSGCYSQSPPTTKNDKRFRQTSNELPRRASVETKTTKLGSFQQNTEVKLQFGSGELKAAELSPQLARNKDYLHDDGNDSGVTSPQRLDSDDNMSVYSDSGALSSRKESLESLSGPSPHTERRLPSRQHSIGSSSNDERSPPLQKSSFVVSPTCPAVQEEKEAAFTRRDPGRTGIRKSNNKRDASKQTPSDGSSPSRTNIKRSDVVRRRGANFSPRASKRELYSIMPGDGNDYEEKILALLDPENSGNGMEQACTDVVISDVGSEPMSPTSPVSPTTQNSDWWLSGNQYIPKRMANSPKDKATALNIISSVIDSKSRQRLNSENKNQANDPISDNNIRRNPLLSPTIVRRTGLSSFNPELSKRIDNFNQKKEEHQKKMTSILSDLNEQSNSKPSANKTSLPTSAPTSPLRTVNNLRSPTGSLLSESRLDKFDRYLQQVSDLLSDSETQVAEREKINSILKNFQTASEVIDRQPKRTSSESVRPNPTVTTVTRRLHRSKSGPMSRTRNPTMNNRNSPLLDDTYSKLNYSKLYPR